jgi:hypothetical protein
MQKNKFKTAIRCGCAGCRRNRTGARNYKAYILRQSNRKSRHIAKAILKNLSEFEDEGIPLVSAGYTD